MPQPMPSMPTGLGSLAMSDNEPRTEDRSPEGLIFSIESDIKNMMKDYEVAVRNGENQRAQEISNQINMLDVQKSKLQVISNLKAPYNTNQDIEIMEKIIDAQKEDGWREFIMEEMQQRKKLAGGGEALKQIPEGNKGLPNLPEDVRNSMGYFQDGGEAINSELEGMEMTEEQAMSELEESRGEFEQLQMLADVVKKLLNEGMGEAEIVSYLKEQGLDDEDIETLFSFLQEMSGQEAVIEQQGAGQIDQQLQGMM